jgi:glyoxylase-like metal-dependent hydrolase (beta-lactamase superfamily II)/8-oxo-dGTP pyrophosphatase MutT (NUDIX family)
MTETHPGAGAVIRPAATLILLRDGADGLEVFMQQRTASAAFFGGAYVFPGGALDAEDNEARLAQRVVGLTAEAADARLSLQQGALAYWIAAIRECFEESGILLACDAAGAPAAPERLAAASADRDALNRSEIDFATLLERHGLMLPGSELVYFDHWITPPIRPRRFDTRFFIARAPHGQHGAHDNAETVASVWLSPREALARGERREIEIVFATGIVLNELARFASVDALLDHVRAKDHIPSNRVAVAQGAKGRRHFAHRDAPYHEIHWSDPEETTQTTYDIVAGVPKKLDRYVTRIVAPNPGKMTGPGTNSYLVGEDELAVIDPGPPIDSHVAAILAAGQGRIRWILCTHTHRDHSPAARALQQATGARVIGYPAPPGETQDSTFAPDWQPKHGERLALGGIAFTALHTPGHASNHLCYLLESTRMLFTGDHVMQGSTVVINPPDGDMHAYLHSLEALLAQDIAIIAPGHGYLVGDPHREIRHLIRHRTWRENRVLDALARADGATCEALVPVVYADVPVGLHPAAARSLLAHLGKLVVDGRAVERDGCYFVERA